MLKCITFWSMNEFSKVVPYTESKYQCGRFPKDVRFKKTVNYSQFNMI